MKLIMLLVASTQLLYSLMVRLLQLEGIVVVVVLLMFLIVSLLWRAIIHEYLQKLVSGNIIIVYYNTNLYLKMTVITKNWQSWQPLTDSIQYVKGVGPKRAELFKRLGINTVEDVLTHLPRRYEDRGNLKKSPK